MNTKNSLSQSIEEWSILADKYEDIMYDNVVDIIRNTIILFKEKFKDKQPSYNVYVNYRTYSWSSLSSPTDLQSHIEREIFKLIPERFRSGEYVLYHMLEVKIKEYNFEEDAWEALLIAWIEYEALCGSRIL